MAVFGTIGILVSVINIESNPKRFIGIFVITYILVMMFLILDALERRLILKPKLKQLTEEVKINTDKLIKAIINYPKTIKTWPEYLKYSNDVLCEFNTMKIDKNYIDEEDLRTVMNNEKERLKNSIH